MAVLSAWDDLRRFPGAQRVLAAHGPALPQPDQLCGPFALSCALHAVTDHSPSLLDLAQAAGTAIWPEDVAAWRPTGAPLDRTGWDVLPRAGSLDESGTDAAGLAGAVGPGTRGDVAVVPARSGGPAAWQRMLEELCAAPYDVGVVANVRTGPMAGTENTSSAGARPVTWDVGHFVVLLGITADGRVAVADSYRELGADDAPPGCRLVSVEALTRGVDAEPGRGVLLLVGSQHSSAVTDLVVTSGLSAELWSA